jgi:hypothetical protein
MKNEQLKELQFPTRTDLQQPVFTWAKTALIGDEHIIWWLYYGDARGKRTLCHRVFHPKSRPLDHRTRMVKAIHLRSTKHQLRQEWRSHYPEATP